MSRVGVSFNALVQKGPLLSSFGRASLGEKTLSNSGWDGKWLRLFAVFTRGLVGDVRMPVMLCALGGLFDSGAWHGNTRTIRQSTAAFQVSP